MITSSVIAILTGVAFVAGVFDGIAGGGGLIALPALLLAGLDPLSALATSKLQGSFGTGSAALEYARHGHIDLRKCRLIVVTTFLAACLGAFAVRYAPISFLSAAMPILLIVMAEPPCSWSMSRRDYWILTHVCWFIRLWVQPR